MSEKSRNFVSESRKCVEKNAYNISSKEYGDLINTVVQYTKAIMRLNALGGQLPTNGCAEFENENDPENPIVLDRKRIDRMNTKLLLALKDLKKYNVSNKKSESTPNDAKGTYTPVYAGEALKAFFGDSPDKFGPLSPTVDYLMKNDKRQDALDYVRKLIAEYKELSELEKNASVRTEDAENELKKARKDYDEFVQTVVQDKKKIDLTTEEKNRMNFLDEVVKAMEKKRKAESCQLSFFRTELTEYAHIKLMVDDNASVEDMLTDLRVPMMNYMTRTQEGHLLKNSITVLLYIYSYHNGLQSQNNGQYTNADDYMKSVFGGDIPADFYKQGSSKYLMSDAVKKGLIKKEMNVFDVVKKKDKKFDPNKQFNIYYFQNIISLMYYSKKYLEEDADKSDKNLQDQLQILKNSTVLDDMVFEHALAKSVSKDAKYLKEITK